MHKTEIGIKIYERGDEVTIRTGKVRYTVTGDVTDRGQLVVTSNNTGKAKIVETEADLHLVTNVREREGWKAEEAPVEETSAYAKAVLFALNKLQKHVYAGTVRKNVKAQRRALNGRQKASRKANR